MNLSRPCVDTETGEVYDPLHYCDHKAINPDTNEYDTALFNVGVPRQLDSLIDAKRYRRRVRAIIKRGDLRYLCAAAEMARERGMQPSHYFATMISVQNWPGTKAQITRSGAARKYRERGEYPDEEPAGPSASTLAAAGWMTAALTANGPMPSTDFSAKAAADGQYHSRSAFDRARKLADVQTGRAGGQGWWVWLDGQERPVESQLDKTDIRHYQDDPAVLAASAGGLELTGLVGLDLASHPSNFPPTSQPKEGQSLGVGIPGGDRPIRDPDMDAHYPRFSRSCVLASVQAEFNAVPTSRRLHRNQQPRPVTPRELDELLDVFDAAGDDPGDCVLWRGTTDKDGYGIFKTGGKQYRAHRWLWMLRHGPIAAGLEMAHHASCPRHCVIHVTPETKKKNLAERRKPRPRGQRESELRQRRDDIRAARFREEQAKYWATPQDQREAEYRAQMDCL